MLVNNIISYCSDILTTMVKKVFRTSTLGCIRLEQYIRYFVVYLLHICFNIQSNHEEKIGDVILL